MEARALAKRLVEDSEYRASLERRLRSGKAGRLEVILWHYAYGKPKEFVEHSGNHAADVRTVVVHEIYRDT